MKETPENYLSVAKKAALAAGKLLMNSYGKLKSSQIQSKSKNDFVTELDKRSEALIISIIRAAFPKHGIQGEESGLAAGDDALWIIDPLDGTANYIHQFPMFSVSIGIMAGKRMQAGVIYDPLHRELFTAVRGQGSFLNSKRFRVSPVDDLSSAMMATGIPFRARDRYDEYMNSFKTISMATGGMRRGGSAAIDLAYVACGRLDGFWEINLSPWDIAAGSLIIEEAGGKVTDMWGRDEYLYSGDILGSNTRLHADLQAITSRTLTPKDKIRR